MADVSLRGVDKHYGSVQALHGIDLDIVDGEFAVFVGPSGCGKSTLLRSIAGLEGISGGAVTIGGADVTRAAPSDRGVAMVFQSYALYPHMTVAENMAFGMKVNRVDRGERERRIGEAARILQIEPLLDRKPGRLSGGQRQRVAIGRAIVRQPKVFLFDEPLSNLDAKLRIQMRGELEQLHRELGATMIYVTHDQVEAMTMADKIVVLRDGRVEQVGAPMDLYHRPATEFVADFIGAPSMNILDLDRVDSARVAPAGAARLGIRPEHVALSAGEAGLRGEVVNREALGGETFLYLRIPSGARLTAKTDGDHPARVGDTLGIALPPERMHFFGADGTTLRPGRAAA